MNKRIVIGMSGATGAIFGIRALETLRETDIETHLIISNAAKRTIRLETSYKVSEVEALADYCHDVDNIGASVASGSFKTLGMAVLPCSIKTLSGIANSFNVNLLIRAADVCLKERRRVVLMVRETPFHKGHFQLMMRAVDMGAIICPPIPSFYKKPKTLEEMVDQIVGRVLDLFDIETNLVKRWSERDGAEAMALLERERKFAR